MYLAQHHHNDDPSLHSPLFIYNENQSRNITVVIVFTSWGYFWWGPTELCKLDVASDESRENPCPPLPPVVSQLCPRSCFHHKTTNKRMFFQMNNSYRPCSRVTSQLYTPASACVTRPTAALAAAGSRHWFLSNRKCQPSPSDSDRKTSRRVNVWGKRSCSCRNESQMKNSSFGAEVHSGSGEMAPQGGSAAWWAETKRERLL